MLNQPISVKNLKISNRIVMAPMASEKSINNKAGDDIIDYYQKRAGNTGLIIVEHSYVSKDGIASLNQLSMASDDVIDGFKVLNEVLHMEGCKTIAQINHAGGMSISDNPIAPSPVSLILNQKIPKQMDKTDIDNVVKSFSDAALRVKKSGFDGVEIHAAHGFLLSQFYSPLTNKRSDKYSGSTLDGRCRLHNDIIKAIRKAVGDDFLVAIRFGAYDYMNGGSRIEEIPEAVKGFVQSGADLIDISGGLNGYTNPMNTRPGWFKQLSGIVKDSADVPVILTGGVKTKMDGESLLNEGVCDLVGVGRAMLVNPKWSLG